MTTTFAVAAVLLAMLGVYGVLSYLITQRNRELGVRIALGATRFDVQQLVLGDAARLVGVGLILGVGAASGSGRLLKGMLFGITATDPTTYLTVVCAIGVTAFVACEIPALRATRMDPVQALRSE
ncbi:MAG TPA: FtsX-like permease family protein [Vicinamibacterales bacterium]|nr:FtsX-like permease family protein [Vicinamibacterales bacterium]